MSNEIVLGGRFVGNKHPVYIIGEIGLNHNGDIEIAKKLIDAACLAGVDAVKFQKRTPEVVVPKDQRDVMRDTPWGRMTYMEYRYRVEFGEVEYREIDRYCQEKHIHWFASPWDEGSVDFLEQFEPPCYKIPSACLTDANLLQHIANSGRPVILSTGMSTMDQIRNAVKILPKDKLVILHCTSTYPSNVDEINLKMIHTLQKEFNFPIGYSGHEAGLQISYAAVALGACVVERHITLDRTMWGSDHSASVEPWGLMKLVRDIRVIEKAIGDGKKKVYDSEKAIMAKLRRKY